MQKTDSYTFGLVHILCFSRSVKIGKTKMLRQSGGVDKPQTMFRLRRNAVPADEKEAHLMRTLVLCIKGGPVEAELLERASFTCLLPAAGSSQ